MTFAKRMLGGLRRFIDHYPLLALTALCASFALVAVAATQVVLRSLH
jgi:hypothetical protein